MQNEIRKKIKSLRDNLDKNIVDSASLTITEKAIEIIKTLNAKTFMVYKSFKNEVKTDKIIEFLLSSGKTVAYPITFGDDMVAGVPTSSEYKKSSLGVLEPTSYTTLDVPDVVFVPLVACDKNKNRIGLGKGYYDRFLKCKGSLKIGICYDFQVVENIYKNSHDIPLDIIITEKQIIGR